VKKLIGLNLIPVATFQNIAKVRGSRPDI